MSKITQFTTGIRGRIIIETYQHCLKKNDDVLDVGCGDGILSEILRDTFQIKIKGCDIDNYLQKKIPFVPMKNHSLLPFADKSFDAVMFNDALHHISFVNQKKLLKEAFRVSDRVLIFEVEPTLMGTIVDWTINKFHSLRMPVTLTFRTHPQWMQLFESMGIQYQFRKVRKPFLYPTTHEAFFLYKIASSTS
jgi:ubiquinone/menaquinone biosynthesis C-methylase UbiE